MKHHFVPVFYLKHWAGPDGKVCEYSRPYGDKVKARRVHPSGTGYVNDLYAAPSKSDEGRNRLEVHFFSPADSAAADAMAKLHMSSLKSMSNREKSAWSRFIMSLLMRGPNDLHDLQRLFDMYTRHPDFLRANYGQACTESDPATLEEWITINREMILREGVTILPALIDNPALGNQLNNMIWSVLTLPQRAYPLLTSDMPLILTSTLNRKDSYIMLPIGERKIFLACNDRHFVKRIAYLECCEFAKRVNQTVSSFASKYAWGRNDSALNFVNGCFATQQGPQLIGRIIRERERQAIRAEEIQH